MHFLPHGAFTGSNELICLKVFCKWEIPAQVCYACLKLLGFHYDPEKREPAVPLWED